MSRPQETLESLPDNWYNDVLELYKEGASDVEIKALIYQWRGSFSNNLWNRWMEDSIEFYETIKKGRELRGKKTRLNNNQKHLIKLEKRRLTRKSEYVGSNKIICSLRSLLSIHLKNRNINFSKKTFEMLGYTKEEYISNITSKLRDGMTFDNYGEWHIDHIKPISLFDLSKEEELKKCWGVDNLDPKWAMENLQKSNKYVSS